MFFSHFVELLKSAANKTTRLSTEIITPRRVMISYRGRKLASQGAGGIIV